MPTSSTSTTSLSSSIDLNGLRRRLRIELLEFITQLESHLTSDLTHDNHVVQQAIQKIRNIVIITQQWDSACDDTNVSTAWVAFILDENIVWDKELLKLFVTFVEHTSLPVARFDRFKLTQQQYGDTMDLDRTDNRRDDESSLDSDDVSSLDGDDESSLDGQASATPVGSLDGQASATPASYHADDHGQSESEPVGPALAVADHGQSGDNAGKSVTVGPNAGGNSGHESDEDLLNEDNSAHTSTEAYPLTQGRDFFAANEEDHTASSGASMKKVLENSIAHYKDKIPAFWYASHIAMLNDIKSSFETGDNSEAVGKLVDYNFHFTDGIVRPQSLIGGWFNRGTLFSKSERVEKLEEAITNTPVEIVEALACKRKFENVNLESGNKNQVISAIFCWDLSSRGSKSRKALQKITGAYITNGAQDLIQVDPTDETSQSIAKVTVLKSLVYNGLKSYLSDKTKSWTDKLSKVIAKLKQRSNDSNYQALDDQDEPIIAEKNRFAATNVCALFNLRTDVMDPNTYEGLHNQDALNVDLHDVESVDSVARPGV